MKYHVVKHYLSEETIRNGEVYSSWLGLNYLVRIINLGGGKVGENDARHYSQSTSPMTSIFENETIIQIPLCNVLHLNGILKISLEIFPKKTR